MHTPCPATRRPCWVRALALGCFRAVTPP